MQEIKAMLKVSFKENSFEPAKKVERIEDKVTVVTLKGQIQFGVFYGKMSGSMITKLYQHPFIENGALRVQGKAKRSEGDADNPILGERIAEARAKIKLYKFMQSFCKSIMEYYMTLLFGDIDIASKTKAYDSESIIGAYKKYGQLLATEQRHLENLLKQA